MSFSEVYSHREMDAAGGWEYYSPIFLEMLNAKGLKIFTNNSPISVVSDRITGWLKRSDSVLETIFEVTGIINSLSQKNAFLSLLRDY
uniref:Uncharacterized protein n=1 Tax=Parascaris univalens TaxID=6257 RepID=A0A915BF22_PARUN